jgi:hypothetical protein
MEAYRRIALIDDGCGQLNRRPGGDHDIVKIARWMIADRDDPEYWSSRPIGR